MTIGSATSKNTYTGTNTTATYSYSFYIQVEGDLEVWERNGSTDVETELTLNAVSSGFTVSGAGQANGGTITLSDGNLATGNVLVIRRKSDFLQSTAIRNQSKYFASLHEDAFDKSRMIDQLLKQLVDRSLKLSPTTDESAFDMDLPFIDVTQSNMSLVVNSTGTGFALADGANDDTLNNNTCFVARNAADNGNVGIIKVNTSDKVELCTDVALLNLTNNTFLQGRNNADSAYVQMFAISTSDKITTSVDFEALGLTNDTFLHARNNADSGDVNIIKVNTSDKLETIVDFAALGMVNNVAVHSRNNADSADIDLIKINTSDKGVLVPLIALDLYETGAGTEKITIQAPASLTANYTLTLPDNDGAANQVLKTDGAGVLSWTGVGINSSINDVSSADYTVTDSDGYRHIHVTTGAADRTITYPTAADNDERQIRTTKIDAGAGKVIIKDDGGTTIFTLVGQGEYIDYVCDGTSWFVTAQQTATYVSATHGVISAGTSNQYKDMASVALEAGDWDLHYQGAMNDNGATVSPDNIYYALSEYSGNTTTDHVNGDNVMPWDATNLGGNPDMGGSVRWRLKVAAATTVYAKFRYVYSAGTPEVTYGKLSARRMA